MIRWGDLTDKQKANFGNGCGGDPSHIVRAFKVIGLKHTAWLIMRAFSLIPQFKFQYSCRQHDFYYARGGWLFDKLRADFIALGCWIKDAWEVKYFYGIGNIFYTIMAMFYFILLLTLGNFFFRWGRYKTKKEILND